MCHEKIEKKRIWNLHKTALIEAFGEEVTVKWRAPCDSLSHSSWRVQTNAGFSQRFFHLSPQNTPAAETFYPPELLRNKNAWDVLVHARAQLPASVLGRLVFQHFHCLLYYFSVQTRRGCAFPIHKVGLRSLSNRFWSLFCEKWSSFFIYLF